MLSERGLASVTLTSRESLAWPLCGARVTVLTNGDAGLLAAGSGRQDTVVIAAGAGEVLTADPAWPAIDVNGVLRPALPPVLMTEPTGRYG